VESRACDRNRDPTDFSRIIDLTQLAETHGESGKILILWYLRVGLRHYSFIQKLTFYKTSSFFLV
jgi:hypothetical protein